MWLPGVGGKTRRAWRARSLPEPELCQQQVHMGNATSKAPEETEVSNVPLPPPVDLHSRGRPGQGEGITGDEYNPDIFPEADNVDEYYPRSPVSLGIHREPSEGMILEQTEQANLPRHSLGDITNVHQPSCSGSDIPSSSITRKDASLPASNTLTTGYATDLAESSAGLNAPGHDGSEVLRVSNPSDSRTTTIVINDRKQARKKRDKERNSSLTEDKREQINARRREAYRNKKEGTIKLQDENNKFPRPPLGNITNVDQPSHAISGLTASGTLTSGVIHDKELSRRQREKERMRNIIDEQREQRNARRRATYRKKKEEGTINLNVTA